MCRGAQYMTSGSKTYLAAFILGWEALVGMTRYPGGWSDGSTYQAGL
jgi:hypothetical protein